MKIWKVIFATAVIFTAGLLAGLVAGRKTQPSSPAPKEPIPPIWSQQRFYEKLRKELDLTADQTNRINKVFAEGNEQVRVIWDLLSPELQKQRQETYESVRAVLNPEQRAKFEKLVKERPQMRKPDLEGQRGRGQKPGTNSGPRGPRPDAAAQTNAVAR